MKKKIISILGMLLFLGSLTSFSEVQASELKFSVEPIIPENQKDLTKSYFDLNIKPKDQQTIKIHMRNDTDNEVVVEPLVKSATTNINGVVEYGESNTHPDKTIPYKLEDILKPVINEVKIPAKGSFDLDLAIAMPEKEFDGVLAGGITLKEKEDPNEKKESKGKGLAIENKYAYVVAVVLHENGNDVDSKLKLRNVEPDQVNARNVINATLQNTQSKYMNQLSVETKIVKKNEKKALYTSKKEGMQMAPNTSFKYPIFLNGEKLKAGKYTLDMVAKSMGSTWHFKKDFEITSDVAKTLNNKDVTIKADFTWIYILVGVLLLLLALLLLFFIIKRKKKEKKEEYKLK